MCALSSSGPSWLSSRWRKSCNYPQAPPHACPVSALVWIHKWHVTDGLLWTTTLWSGYSIKLVCQSLYISHKYMYRCNLYRSCLHRITNCKQNNIYSRITCSQWARDSSMTICINIYIISYRTVSLLTVVLEDHYISSGGRNQSSLCPRPVTACQLCRPMTTASCQMGEGAAGVYFAAQLRRDAWKGRLRCLSFEHKTTQLDMWKKASRRAQAPGAIWIPAERERARKRVWKRERERKKALHSSVSHSFLCASLSHSKGRPLVSFEYLIDPQMLQSGKLRHVNQKTNQPLLRKPSFTTSGLELPRSADK